MNDLERFRQEVAVRDAVGQTVQRGVERARLGMAAEQRRACRRERPLVGLEIGEDVPEVSRVERLAESEQHTRAARFTLHLPDSGEIGFAVQHRRRRRHVDLAVRRAGRPGSGVVHPLGAGGDAGGKTRDCGPEGAADMSAHTRH